MSPTDTAVLSDYVRWLDSTPAADTVNVIDFELTGPDDVATTYRGSLEAMTGMVNSTPQRFGPDIPVEGLIGAQGLGVATSFSASAALVALYFGFAVPNGVQIGPSQGVEIYALEQVDPAVLPQPNGPEGINAQIDGANKDGSSLILSVTQWSTSPLPPEQRPWDERKWRLRLTIAAASTEKIP